MPSVNLLKISYYALFFSSLVACSALPSSNQSIHLKEMGSFHVGGKEVLISGKPIQEVLSN
jgi:hypothetical protein